MEYRANVVPKKRDWLKPLIIFLSLILVTILGFIGYKLFFTPQTVEEKIENQLSFDESVTESEKDLIRKSIENASIELTSNVSAFIETTLSPENQKLITGVYVPISTFNSAKQQTTIEELTEAAVYIDSDIEEGVRNSIATTLNLSAEKLILTGPETVALDEEVKFIDFINLNHSNKLLTFNESYYLDTFSSGAIFRQVIFSGDGAAALEQLDLKHNTNEEEVYKVNMTGVTALTREMQKKLATVKDPLYFSANIGEFLADADLTHVSNEVSFKENCAYSYTLFCSPPEFIETLKASGVDLVEITGNHNNDLGAEFNTATINLYSELGWNVVGGGLNSEEASKPFISDAEGSKVAFLAYNFPDSPNGGAIAGAERAGANSFDFTYESIKKDIESAKENADFVVVNIQYWECYSYPDGYVEFPICDKPIDGQEETFKKMIDLGADMVIGSSAHQPQTYELYEGKAIYYGLGNLYFEQTQWPGTERGIVLTHYFKDGVLLQTKLTPTVFDRDFQTRIMNAEEANYLLTRLKEAR